MAGVVFQEKIFFENENHLWLDNTISKSIFNFGLR